MENQYDPIMIRIAQRSVADFPPPTEEEMREFELAIGYELPRDYRHFLFKYGFSAGQVDLSCPLIDGLSSEDIASVNVFYGLASGHPYDLRSVRHIFQQRPFGRHLPASLLAIADSDGGEICLSLAGSDAGQIYWWGHHGPTDDSDENVSLLAFDFDRFMNSLRCTP